ncbi:hypothetical protein BC832DRAFT_596084 [Gaertneriomyces semiglobifer]|nr:hypothetical protein BC832DRAFT_596084 [Gaertneriomyces semiglobifer]
MLEFEVYAMNSLSPLSPTYPMNQAPARGMPLPPQQLPQLQRLRSAPKDRRASGLRVVNPSTHNFDGDAPGSMDGRPGEMPLSPTPVYPPQPVSTGHPTLDISFDERAVLAERGMSESPISVSSGRTF